MENPISFEELDKIAGEVLPERTVLGVLATPFNHGGGPGSSAGAGSSSSAAATGGGVFAPAPSDHGTTMLSSCQAIDHPQPAGLLSSLSLNSQNPNTTFTCIPAAVSSH